jgi:hypothetical protein
LRAAVRESCRIGDLFSLGYAERLRWWPGGGILLSNSVCIGGKSWRLLRLSDELRFRGGSWPDLLGMASYFLVVLASYGLLARGGEGLGLLRSSFGPSFKVSGFDTMTKPRSGLCLYRARSMSRMTGSWSMSPRKQASSSAGTSSSKPTSLARESTSSSTLGGGGYAFRCVVLRNDLGTRPSKVDDAVDCGGEDV